MKYLVASGCSFTDENANHASQSGPNYYRSLFEGNTEAPREAEFETWVSPLAKIFGASIYNYGMNSSGNSLISRKAIFGVSQLLKKGVDPKDILCGVEWSGPDRHDFMLESQREIDDRLLLMGKPLFKKDIHPLNRAWADKFAPGNAMWLILNAAWADADPFADLYYNNFFSRVGGKTNTLEKILATQHYLESVGVKYFFTVMSEDTLLLENDFKEDVQYLYDLIDFTKFLPIKGMYEWCRDVCLPQGMKWLERERRSTGIKHPTAEMNRMFTEQVIAPHLGVAPRIYRTRGYNA